MRSWKLIVLVPLACYLAAAAAIAVAGLRDRLVPAGAIVVLGNTVNPDGQPSPRLRAGVPVAGTVHARYFEPRDLYSLAREVIGFGAYLVSLKGA